MKKLLNIISFRDRFATFETLGGGVCILGGIGAMFLYITGLLLVAFEAINGLIPYVAIPTGLLGVFLFLRNRG